MARSKVNDGQQPAAKYGKEPTSRRMTSRAAKMIAASLMLAPTSANAMPPPNSAPMHSPALSRSSQDSRNQDSRSLDVAPQPKIDYSEAFRDDNFSCETGGGRVRIRGDVEGGQVEFPVPFDMGRILGISRIGTRLRLLSENYLIIAAADGSRSTSISLPDDAKGAISAWLSTESMFYVLSSRGKIYATRPEQALCPWYSGSTFRVVDGARLVEARGLIAIVQSSDNPIILFKVVPDGDWPILSMRINFMPEGQPSVSITGSRLRASFSNCDIELEIASEGEIGSVVPQITRH